MSSQDSEAGGRYTQNAHIRVGRLLLEQQKSKYKYGDCNRLLCNRKSRALTTRRFATWQND